MSEDEFNKELRRWACLMTKRGNAGTFARETAGDRALVEQATAQEWARSLSAEYRIKITNIRNNPDDPPDCIGTLNNAEIGIELTELVRGEIFGRINYLQDQGRYATAARHLFPYAQWDELIFHSELGKRLENKGHAYRNRKEPIDALVIYSGEHWLLPENVQDWLTDFQPPKSDKILNAFFLLDYRPDGTPHWPIFPLYGPLTHRR